MIKNVCKDEEVDENIFISITEIEEEDKVPTYVVVDVADVDGKEEVMEEINFVDENEIKKLLKILILHMTSRMRKKSILLIQTKLWKRSNGGDFC